MKTVCKQVYAKYPDFDLTDKKDFIKATVKAVSTCVKPLVFNIHLFNKQLDDMSSSAKITSANLFVVKKLLSFFQFLILDKLHILFFFIKSASRGFIFLLTQLLIRVFTNRQI